MAAAAAAVVAAYRATGSDMEGMKTEVGHTAEYCHLALGEDRVQEEERAWVEGPPVLEEGLTSEEDPVWVAV